MLTHSGALLFTPKCGRESGFFVVCLFSDITKTLQKSYSKGNDIFCKEGIMKVYQMKKEKVKMKITIKKAVSMMLVAVIALTSVMMASCKKKNNTVFDDSKNITVITREDGSGTKSAFMELLGLKGKEDVSGVMIAYGTAAILAEVKSNPLAIAFDSLGYVTDDVKMIKVDGVEATVENIKNGTYKISRPLQVVYQPDKMQNTLNSAFLSFLQSSEAQAIIKAEGYVSTYDNAKAYTTDASLSGELGISGSTSLQPLMIKLVAKYKELQPNVTVTVAGGGSGTGYKNAENGTSDFGMISEVFNSGKAPSCTNYEVAKDGIAIIVNKSNPIDDIKLETLKNIYNCEAGDSAVKTWADAKK